MTTAKVAAGGRGFPRGLIRLAVVPLFAAALFAGAAGADDSLPRADALLVDTAYRFVPKSPSQGAHPQRPGHFNKPNILGQRRITQPRIQLQHPDFDRLARFTQSDLAEDNRPRLAIFESSRATLATTPLERLYTDDAEPFSMLSGMSDAQFERLLDDASGGSDSLIGSYKAMLASSANTEEVSVTTFVDWVRDQYRRYDSAGVRGLSGLYKHQLDQFVLRKTGAAADFDTETEHYREWRRARVTAQEAEKLRLRSLGQPLGQPMAATLQQLPQETAEQRYRRLGVQSYISKHPALEQMRLAGWNLDAMSPRDLGIVFAKLNQPLPGGLPELVLVFGRHQQTEIGALSEAWRGNGAARPAPHLLQHDDIERLLDGYRNKTLVLVGHIDGADFVVQAESGAALSMNILSLTQMAREKGVFLIPVGCSSLQAQASFGFQREVGIREVAKFLQAIPAADATVGGLLVALGVIGTVEVRASGGQFTRDLQVVVRKPGSKTAEGRHEADGTKGATSQHAEQAAQGGSSTAGVEAEIVLAADAIGLIAGELAEEQAFEEAVTAEAEALRPWHDRGVLRWWRDAFRASPLTTLLLSCGATLALAWLLHASAWRRDHATALAPKALYRAAAGMFLISVLLGCWTIGWVLTEVHVVPGLMLAAGAVWLLHSRLPHGQSLWSRLGRG